MTPWTLARVALPTVGELLMTRETVRFDTPDSRATSLIVACWPLGSVISRSARSPRTTAVRRLRAAGAEPLEVQAQAGEELAARVVELAGQVHRAVTTDGVNAYVGSSGPGGKLAAFNLESGTQPWPMVRTDGAEAAASGRGGSGEAGRAQAPKWRWARAKPSTLPRTMAR